MHTDRMRMHFDADDEAAFHTRRDELGAQFAAWLTTHGVPGDPDDAGLLMDWKWGYDDGALDRWTVDHVRGFLFGWCPRKLAAAPADCAEVPISVAAFVEFLAHTGLLGPGSDPPTRIRKFCVRSVSDFVREMGNPANFGMAKSLFGGAPDAPRSQVEALLHQLDQLPSEVLDAAPDGVELPEAVIGPVRLPAEDERRAAVRAAPIMAKLRALTDLLAAPGREPGVRDRRCPPPRQVRGEGRAQGPRALPQPAGQPEVRATGVTPPAGAPPMRQRTTVNITDRRRRARFPAARSTPATGR